MAMEPVAAFTPRPVLQDPGPFPVSSTARTIGEQKAKVKSFYQFLRRRLAA
jgi:predicted ATP-grasp superfamily ATP-dependent carboligase